MSIAKGKNWLRCAIITLTLNNGKEIKNYAGGASLYMCTDLKCQKVQLQGIICKPDRDCCQAV